MEIRRCTVADIQSASDMVAEYSGCRIEGMPYPSVEWDRYRQMEEAGIVALFGAYAYGKLIGFTVLINQVSLHYGVQVTLADSLFVMADYRKTGAGIRLIRVMHKYAEDTGSKGLIVVAPMNQELSVLLPKMEFRPSHTAYFRSIGDV